MVLGHIHDKVLTAPRANKEHLNLYWAALNWTYYTLSHIGDKSWFYACKNDQHWTEILGIKPITDKYIMASAALDSFGDTHHGDQLQCIAES